MITERENVYKCTNDNCKAYVYKTWWEVVITPNHIRKLIGHPGTISVQKLTKSGHKKRIRLQVGELLKEGRL
jgi:REP element-mobilizing transposase RayT